MKTTLSAAARMVAGRHVGPDRSVNGVATDTRLLNRGDLFVALQGPRFDGHDFLEQARTRGAAGALVEREQQAMLPLIVVPDTLRALGRLAASWRERLDAMLVAVTGSNGKTSVKDMLAAILAQAGPVLATEGNLNNEIGLPMTLLRLRQSDRYAVLEMGANHPGEIGYLTRIARPSVAIITNAGLAHLEGFGDVEGVARAKGEILEGLRPGGVAVVNADDPFRSLWLDLAGSRRIMTFGVERPADVVAQADGIETDLAGGRFTTRFRVSTPAGGLNVRMSLIGLHNVRNALAASAAALAAGASLQQIEGGLAAVRAVPGRLEPRVGLAGAWVIDDTYNANPSSLAAALDALSRVTSERWLVLGDMAELGEGAHLLHANGGRLARERGFRRLLGVGGLSRSSADAFGPGGEAFRGRPALIGALREQMRPGVLVLVKGSRASRMEEVVDALLAQAPENDLRRKPGR
jgi:UDP-N-acetylmuramoyl-tripeptide--D-alanyl-D-alanine ligase